MVLKHAVLIRPKPELSEEQLTGVIEGLKELKHKVPYVEDLEYGTDVSVEGADLGLKHDFLFTFADKEARDKYLNHPDHVAWKSNASKLGFRPGQDFVIVDFVPKQVA